jgi:hypothetical protein
VKEGSLKLQKKITLEKTNYIPSKGKEWQACTERDMKRRKICEIYATQYFGIFDE